MFNILFHDYEQGQWLHFVRPRKVLRADRISDVLPLLNEVETLVENRGLFAAGWISYEASPAFDAALQTHPAGTFPLACFGIFDPPSRLQEMQSADTDCPRGQWCPSVTREEYARAISRIKEHIAAGDTYQVNYTLRLRNAFHQNPWNFFLNTCADARYGAFVEAPPYFICSASPELFFSLDGKTIRSKPMKGTMPRGRTTAEDAENSLFLYNSEKNRAENVMIVDMIRNDIGRTAEFGTVHVPLLYEIEKYPTVLQMTSTVEARTKAPFTEIMRTLFPCASITGAPKAKTMELISSLESTPRNIYTGTIGYFGPDRRALFNVAIRTTLIDTVTSLAEYGAGGGIVWDSDTQDEYEECLTKAKIILDPVPAAPFSLLETILWSRQEDFFLLARHLERMKDSARYFDFPFDENQILKELNRAVNDLPPSPHRVRLLLFRDGKPGCTAFPLETPAAGPAKVRIAKDPVSSQNPFLFHKTTRRDLYETAKGAFGDADDVILYNERGEITETCVANIVVQLEEGLVTPPLHCGLLGGVYRAELLAEGTITERVISVDDLKKAKKLFLVNSVRKWREAVLLS